MNETTEENQAPTETSTTARQDLLNAIGKKLIAAREQTGESIDEPVRKLKLHKHHLKALEVGNWDKLPDQVYVLGFLRQYARYLNVDLSDELQQLKNDQYALTRPLTFPDPPVAPSRRWAWLTGSAFVILFIGFNVISDDHTQEQVDVEATVQTEAPTSLNSANNPDIDPIETTAQESADLSQPVDQKAALASPQVNEKVLKTAVTEPALLIKPATDSESPPVQQISSMHHFRFEAAGAPVWLQISLPDASGQAKGRLLKEVLLQPGYHTNIREKTETLWITCGNAPSLRIKVDGEIVAARGSLGSGKKVLRDYRFSIKGE